MEAEVMDGMDAAPGPGLASREKLQEVLDHPAVALPLSRLRHAQPLSTS